MRRTSACANSFGWRVIHPTIPGIDGLDLSGFWGISRDCCVALVQWCLMDVLTLGAFKPLKFSCIPRTANTTVPGGERLRNPVRCLVVQANPQRQAARCGQRHIISWQLNLLESVMALEVGQAVLLLPSVIEVCVPQIWNASLSARANCLRHQRIGWRLVSLRNHGDDLHQAGLGFVFVRNQLHKTNQNLPKISANENAPVQVRLVYATNRVKVFAIMP